MPLQNISLNDIRESKVALREVDREAEKYVSLVASVRERGIITPITVRPLKDPETGEDYFALTDGLHRYTAAKDAGLSQIPAHVMTLSEADALEVQIIANFQKIETRAVDYSKQLVRMFSSNPLLTISEVSKKLSVTNQWLENRLSLTNLTAEIGELVNEGKIKLSNAYNLAKLPVEEQVNFVDNAMTMGPQEFPGVVSQRVKELRDAKRQGREAAGPQEFVPVARLQKLIDLKSEIEKPTIGPHLVKVEKPRSLEDAFKLGLRWAVHMDSESVAAAKAKDEARRQELDAAKKKRADERATEKAAELKKKGEEAAATAAAAQEALQS